MVEELRKAQRARDDIEQKTAWVERLQDEANMLKESLDKEFPGNSICCYCPLYMFHCWMESDVFLLFSKQLLGYTEIFLIAEKIYILSFLPSFSIYVWWMSQLLGNTEKSVFSWLLKNLHSLHVLFKTIVLYICLMNEYWPYFFHKNKRELNLHFLHVSFTVFLLNNRQF